MEPAIERASEAERTAQQLPGVFSAVVTFDHLATGAVLGQQVSAS